MQEKVCQPSAPKAQVPAQQAPVRLTPEQLRQVAGAGLQQSTLPGGNW
jgi:hypothetical protein